MSTLVRIEADGTRVVRKNNKLYRIAPATGPVGKYAPFTNRADMFKDRKDPRKSKWYAEAVREARKNPGTYSDHSAYSERVKAMTAAQLRYTINDARAAIRAHPTGHKAGYYADEINYCASELHRRRTNPGTPMLKVTLKRGRKTKTLLCNPGERSAEAGELKLFIDNDGDLYRRQTTYIQQNLSKKFVKGTYDHAKAVKLWMYLVEAGAKKYAKEFSVGTDWHSMFPKNTRLTVAQALADDWQQELKAGNLTLPPKRASTAKSNKYYVVGSIGEIIAKLSSKKKAMALARTHGGSVLMNNPKRKWAAQHASLTRERGGHEEGGWYYDDVQTYGRKAFRRPGAAAAYAKRQARKSGETVNDTVRRGIGEFETWQHGRKGNLLMSKGRPQYNPRPQRGYGGKIFVLGKKTSSSGGQLRFVSGSFLKNGKSVPAFVKSAKHAVRFASRMGAEGYRQNFRGVGLNIYRRD